MLNRRARRLAVIHERLCIRTAAIEMESSPISEREKDFGALFDRQHAEIGVVLRGEDHDFVCAGHAVADDRVLVRHDAHAPVGRLRLARADARDFRRRLGLVSFAERAALDPRRHRFVLHTERVGPQRPRGCEDDAITGELVDEQLLHSHTSSRGSG